jgi:hypothetical protein
MLSRPQRIVRQDWIGSPARQAGAQISLGQDAGKSPLTSKGAKCGSTDRLRSPTARGAISPFIYAENSVAAKVSCFLCQSNNVRECDVLMSHQMTYWVDNDCVTRLTIRAMTLVTRGSVTPALPVVTSVPDTARLNSRGTSRSTYFGTSTSPLSTLRANTSASVESSACAYAAEGSGSSGTVAGA